MLKRRIVGFTLIVSLILGFSSPGFAEDPTDTLKGYMDKALSVLKEARAENRKFDRDELWNSLKGAFDFVVISQLAVTNKNWKKFSRAEKREFVSVFAVFLKNTYMDKVPAEFEYGDESVEWAGQRILSPRKALVRTNIARQEGKKIPVAYSMIKRNSLWRIYNVKVEGMSVLRNYRNQFTKILRTKKPARLIERLKKKVRELDAERLKKGGEAG